MKITKKDVLDTAELARLEFKDDELDKFTHQLEDILEHIEDLNELDTKNIPPTSHVLNISTPEREDVVEELLNTEEVLQNAPESVDNFFVVPKVIDD